MKTDNIIRKRRGTVFQLNLGGAKVGGESWSTAWGRKVCGYFVRLRKKESSGKVLLRRHNPTRWKGIPVGSGKKRKKRQFVRQPEMLGEP